MIPPQLAGSQLPARRSCLQFERGACCLAGDLTPGWTTTRPLMTHGERDRNALASGYGERVSPVAVLRVSGISYYFDVYSGERGSSDAAALA
jgi:hypothetical protein